MKLLTQIILSRFFHQVIKKYEDFSKNQIIETYEDFSKNETLTQKLKCVMKSVNECFFENKILTQKSKCLMKSVFIYMFISNRRIFRLRQNACVSEISNERSFYVREIYNLRYRTNIIRIFVII